MVIVKFWYLSMMNINRQLWFCCVVCCFFISVSLASDATQELSKLLMNMQTLSSDFTQTVTTKKGRRLQTTRGRLQLKRPDKLRWETTEPDPQLIVIHGQSVWIYDIDLQQATHKNLTVTEQQLPLLLLSQSVKKILQDFKVTQLSTTVFELLPIDPDLPFSKIRLSFSGEHLAAMHLVDKLQQVIKIHFFQPQMNQRIDDSVFEFQPPSGIDVIRA